MTHQITNVVSRWFYAIDDCKWQAVELLMAAPFDIDFSSFTNEPPSTCSPYQVIEAWKSLLPGFKATHHQIGNSIISHSSEIAELQCYVIASHVLDIDGRDRTWTIYGRYIIGLVRENDDWKVQSCKFLFRYQDGDVDLPRHARLRCLSDEMRRTK